MEIRSRAWSAFCLTDPLHKMHAVQFLGLEAPGLAIDNQARFESPAQPGRPVHPTLVHPQAVERRSPFTPEGHAALIHSIAHIEFNAINLALDALWRFDSMPSAYYLDWLRVAQEEAKHFSLLSAHLNSVGYEYGAFTAHDGLWTMCDNTKHDIVARMALVPRTLEARGLDATPIIQAKLRKVGTPEALGAVSILDVILAEEVGHVAIGNHWYHWLCRRDALDPYAFYAQAALQYGAPRLKPPFNVLARKHAGFSDAEIAALPV
jgi:uncharacterized ferritin-like protein (DUF455 family)